MTKKSSKEKVKDEEPELKQNAEQQGTEQENTELGADNIMSDEEAQSQERETSEEDRVAELEKQLAEANDKHLRLIAEYDNYRKRTLKEKMELTKLAGEEIFMGILPVVDDFERALQHFNSADNVEALKVGVELIYSKFISYLSSNGVKAIDTDKVTFDADLHEAVTKVQAPTEDMKGKVVDCVEKGYMLDEKVIRFPKVVVGE
ncbi:MAG TPA: nucleotide exchange factor GrpE [Marinilabiliaceae bacterium]|jgi:molecular chaperone GrpE|nr:nucleotide exchange factor GrpE [Marinilabiliaceae bacterium]HBX89444.1 nucleotide exchange factor GrpE [Marinilabiliaceae bacterium]